MLKPKPIWALGTMSGTSLDGVDAAMVLTDGETISEFGETAYRRYSTKERAGIRAAFGQWSDGTDVPKAAEIVEYAHSALLKDFPDAELIGFHGQTLVHDPANRGTHQAGNGQVLAEFLNCEVVSDFRSADVHMGGQGAPLAPFFHFALAKWFGATDPVVFLNLGGVGNLTWVDPRCVRPDEKGALLAFDTGPANAPVNDLMATRLGVDFDKDGALAASGNIEEKIVREFLKDAYFYKIPPKSLDRDAFANLGRAVKHLNNADAAATLVACSVGAVQRGLEYLPSMPARVLVCGGGRHNKTMMSGLRKAIPCDVDAVEIVDLNGDMLEAQAFAYLAVRVKRGLSTSAPGTTGVVAAIGGGTIHRPVSKAETRPK